MKRHLWKASILSLPALAYVQFVAHAQVDPLGSLRRTGEQVYGSGDAPQLTEIVGGLINGVLAVAGIIFVVLVVYGGILYMTAQGDETRIKKAKSLLVSSIIGLIILVSAYAASSFIIDLLTEATVNQPPIQQ